MRLSFQKPKSHFRVAVVDFDIHQLVFKLDDGSSLDRLVRVIDTVVAFVPLAAGGTRRTRTGRIADRRAGLASDRTAGRRRRVRRRALGVPIGTWRRGRYQVRVGDGADSRTRRVRLGCSVGDRRPFRFHGGRGRLGAERVVERVARRGQLLERFVLQPHFVPLALSAAAEEGHDQQRDHDGQHDARDFAGSAGHVLALSCYSSTRTSFTLFHWLMVKAF